MKRRRADGDAQESFPKVSRQGRLKKTKTTGRRVGPGGLSLEAFAAAKSKPLINPAQIREHREFYKNAKKVQKYKKVLKQLGGEGHGVLANIEQSSERPIGEQESLLVNDDIPLAKNGTVRKQRPVEKTDGKQFRLYRKHAQSYKGASQMERLKDEVGKEKLEKERQKSERERERAEQQEALEKARQERKQVQVTLRKKTSRGQPVMKHRLERLLETIQRDP